MKSKTTHIVAILFVLGFVFQSGCSNKNGSDKKPDSSADSSATATTSTTTAQETATNNQSTGSGGTTVPPAQVEMALVVQNYGMAKFSTLKRFYDLGFALFSIYKDGAVSSGSSANLTNYQIDWNSAKVNKYGEAEIFLVTPVITDLNSGQSTVQQEITIPKTIENKMTMPGADKFSARLTIETLVSDTLRTVCALGFSTP